jgi:hypothetical protein
MVNKKLAAGCLLAGGVVTGVILAGYFVLEEKDRRAPLVAEDWATPASDEGILARNPQALAFDSKTGTVSLGKARLESCLIRASELVRVKGVFPDRGVVVVETKEHRPSSDDRICDPNWFVQVPISSLTRVGP